MIYKRHFTLLEVLISLGLTLIIFSFFLAAYFQAQKLGSLTKNQEAKIYSQNLLEQRLEEVFLHLPTIDQKTKMFFTNQSSSLLKNSLILSYQNGVVVSSAYSGEAVGEIGVDEENNLILLTWPEEIVTDKKMGILFPHKDVLFNDVQMISWRFYGINNEGREDWFTVWSKENKSAPLIVELLVEKTSKEKFDFIFLIPDELGIIRQSKERFP